MSNLFKYYKTSPEIICLAVLMYIRFPLSLRNVENLLHEFGIDISHETVRAWWNKFGPVFASDIRKKRVAGYANYTHWNWHLGEVFVKIMKRHGPSQTIITECVACLLYKLRSYKSAMCQLGNMNKQDTTKHHNNRCENSHQPLRRRERAMNKFRAEKSLQKFVP
jgi:putative transposase